MDDKTKVSELPVATIVNDGDTFCIVQAGVSKQVPKSVVLEGIDAIATWGGIEGDITDQTDLQTALNGKLSVGTTTASINDSTNRRFVTDAQRTVIGNTSGVNTGDQDLSDYLQEDPYAQPDIPFAKSGLPFRFLDLQVVTKFTTWDFLSGPQRDAMLDEAVYAEANYVALAVPYEQLAKYTDWVDRARAKGLKIWHRSHRQLWEGSDGYGSVTSITRTSTTATVTTSKAHGLVSGEKVWISGANQTDYNGKFTVTVNSSTTFTYQVANAPVTPATGTILARVDWESNRDYIVNFIKDNPDLFRAGDVFGMTVESSNADGTANQSFRTGGVFQIAKYNQAQFDQVLYANEAFASIGLKKLVYTWGISINVSLLNLGGVAWNNTSGNAGGIGFADFIEKFGGVVCIDHYQDASIHDASVYRAAIKADLVNFAESFPGCYLMQGEIGYHTEDVVTDQNQADVLRAIAEELLAFGPTIGINFWVQMGSNTTSLWNDVDGNITPGGRLAVRDAIIPAFRKNTKYGEYYSDGALGANRERVNFTGDNIQATITDDGNEDWAEIELIPVYSKTVRKNYVPNPSFEPATLLTGWSSYGNADTKERSTSQFNNGTASFRINNATAKDGGILSDPIVLPAGTYTLSAYRKLSAAVDNANVMIREVGGSTLGSGITSGYPGNTNWNRVSFSFTIATQKTVEILLGLGSYGSSSDGEAYFDGILLEEAPSAGVYFDGDSTDTTDVLYSWGGDSGNSVSIEVTLARLIRSGDLVIPDSSKGVLLKAPNGIYWRLKVANDGTVSATNTGLS